MRHVGQEDGLCLCGLFGLLLVSPGFGLRGLGFDLCLLCLQQRTFLRLDHAGIFARDLLNGFEGESIRVTDTDLVDEQLEDSHVPVRKSSGGAFEVKDT